MKKNTAGYFLKDYFIGGKKSNYQNYNWWDHDLNWKHIIKAVKNRGIKGRVLDIGCAFGFLLKRLVPYFSELNGLDISSYAIDRARKEVPNAKLGVFDINLDELPYPDNHFDLITALDVLEHTHSIKNNLLKIRGKLKNSGYLIITLPLKDTWAGKFFGYFDKDKTHISVPSFEEMLKIVNNSDFEIVEKRTYFNLIFIKLNFIPVNLELLLRKRRIGS